MGDDLGRLRDENRRLRELLTRNGIEIPPDPPVLVETLEPRRFSPEAKIRLFRELFRGRDDVYAVRWESPDGRKGYSPKSDRDWKAWYAARPEERQRVDRETRKHVPLTDEAIRAHLQGEITVGIYPLLRDESCWLLAADFDKTTWQEDCQAFLESCSEWNIPAPLCSKDHARARVVTSGSSSRTQFRRCLRENSAVVRQPHRASSSEGSTRSREQRVPR